MQVLSAISHVHWEHMGWAVAYSVNAKTMPRVTGSTATVTVEQFSAGLEDTATKVGRYRLTFLSLNLFDLAEGKISES